MGYPTLLTPGKLVGDAGKKFPDIVPIDYIINWLKRRMPEFGGKPPKVLADRVLIVRSETGSGKSTALPVYIFRLLRSEKTQQRIKLAGPGVISTQPRILTAQTLARDIGSSEHYPDMVLGATVGYQTGPINEKPESGLIYATAGVLLAQMRVMSDAEIIARYRFIIIDEAHERSLAIDSLLMRLKFFLHRNLKNTRLPFVILASATLPVQKYARYFEVGAGNIVEVTGRQFPVRTFYPKTGMNHYPREAAKLALKIHREHDDVATRADILIFMPGVAEIRVVVDELTKANRAYLAKDSEIRPFLVLAITGDVVKTQGRDYRLIKEKVSLLRIPTSDKKELVQPARRIIVSTVVAETGLTIETLKYVIDCGWSRTKEIYFPGEFLGIITRPAPKSRIMQRKGRVGREFAGEFYPLYTKNVYESLDDEQLPAIIAAGVSPIFLDIVSTTAKNHDGIFRVGDIDMLDPPPNASLAAALEKAIAFGYLRIDRKLLSKATQGHVLTKLGETASRFHYLGMSQTQTLFAGYLWKVSIRDLAFIVALYGMREVPLYSTSEKKGSEPQKALAIRAGLPSFLLKRSGGKEKDRPPTEDEAHYYRARLLISDDFIEALLAFEGFTRALVDADGDLARILDWCVANGVDFENARRLAGTRDQVIEEALAAGINPFWGDQYRLAKTTSSTFLDTVVRLKQCIYAGLRLNLLTYDQKKNVYRTQRNRAVGIPRAYTDLAASRLRGLGFDSASDSSKPRKIVTNQISLRPAKGDKRDKVPPLLYRFRAGLVSVLDGYIGVDENFWTPRS